MRLSEAVEMIEDWLDLCTDGYNITSVDNGSQYVKATFEEVGFTRESYLFVETNERRIYNINGDDVLLLGREANSAYPDWIRMYDKFAKRWRYGNEG